MIETLKNYIGGNWVESSATEKLELINPATEELIAYVPLSPKSDVDKAAKAAREAYKTWSKTPVPRRARIMFKYQQLLIEHWAELAKLITNENGKTYTDAYGEVQRGIECVEYAAGIPSLMMGKSLPDIATSVESAMYRYPVGVVGGITPFNFPMMVPCWMFPLAIACGNTFVLKPSEKTPLLSARLAELSKEAGLPDGVLNIVNGAHDVVNGLLEHEEINAISFVGSQPVAEYIYKTAAANGKRVQALAGAKNHSIIMPDADMEYAAEQVITAAYGSAGQRCMACSVLVTVGDAAEKFIPVFMKKAANIKIGNGLEEGVFLGPVISKENKMRTEKYVQIGIDEGATLIMDGRNPKGIEKGYFVGPTIFDNVTTDMKIWKDEIFAPVLSIVRTNSIEEAVEVSNKSQFGNGACIYATNAAAIRYYRENIESGMLGVNLAVPAPMSFFPFSGWKKSFYGDLHCNGGDGVEFYTRRKMITSRLV